MPRPQRCRRVCMEPGYVRFAPEGAQATGTVTLTVDEFEVIRLVDLEGKTHEQCAAQMDISRSTVTEIYESARHKLAESLVLGRTLVIAGGHYQLCRATAPCGRPCPRAQSLLQSPISKGEHTMRIAVTYANGEIFQHFGHTQQIKLYDVENNTVTQAMVVDTNGHGHGALAGFLKEHQVDVLICGGIGGGAQTALANAGIKLYGGVSGSADEAVAALLAGQLEYNPAVQCSHHGHGHGHEGHQCGSHGCGQHNCH